MSKNDVLKKYIDDINTNGLKWSVYDEASHRGGNYADHWIAETKELMRDEGMTLHSVMKEAYLQGFLHGFEHKFDQTNYEEK
jgi:hypothetical protein